MSYLESNGKQGTACKVTFAIPAFKARFLREAIESIVAQHVESCEILVCDDSPDDEVFNTVNRFVADGLENVRFLRNKTQLGGLINIQKCIDNASGEYLKFLNDDDLLLNNCVNRMVEVLDRNPGISVVTSKRTLIDEHSVELPDIVATHNPFGSDAILNGRDLIEFFRTFPINFVGEPSTVLFRTADARGIFPHASSINNRMINSVNDVALYVNLLQKGDLAYLTEPLSCFRTHSGQSQRLGNAEVVGNYGRSVLLAQLDSMEGKEPSSGGNVGVRPLADPSSDFKPFPLKEHLQEVGRIPDNALRTFTFMDQRIEALGQGSSVPMNLWLGGRAPTNWQAPLVREKLENGGRICLVIVDKDPKNYRLGIAISAFRIARWYCPSLSCVVLTTDAGAYRQEYYRDVRFEVTCEDKVGQSVNRVVSDRDADWFMIMDAWSELTPQGLMSMALELQDAPDTCVAVYGDELVRDGGHIGGAVLRPDFNLDMLLSQPSVMARHWLFRKQAIVEMGGFDESFGAAYEFDLILRILETAGFGAFGHVAEPLLLVEPGRSWGDLQEERQIILDHLRRRGYAAAKVQDGYVPGTFQVDYGHPGTPLVSIIIPTKDQLPLLQTCVESILEKTAYKNYELLIVDNNSETPEAKAWLTGLEQMNLPNIRVLRYNKPFNYSAMNNLAARQARGEYLLLLNNDTGMLRADWLDALLNHAQRPEVGIVGAKLLFPNGKVQHAGVVLGLRGPAEHVFVEAAADAPGYMNRLQIDQNYSAVTAACLMVRKEVYDQVEGLDEGALKVSYNDMDFCLKVAQAGYLTVWTPRALVMHVANASQVSVDKTSMEDKHKRFSAERDVMYERWLPQLGNDPAYNRNLSLQGAGFEVEQRIDLNWQPLVWRPLPVTLCYPADPWGCGHYRIIKPFQAMKAAGLSEGLLANERLSMSELARLDPDVVVLQRQLDHDHIEDMRRMKQYANKFMVFELDDYLPNLPMKSAYRNNMPKDILKSMRKAMKWVDRFVVSTYPLADALSGLHPDIQVVENRLPVDWWQGLSTQRQQGNKPRVGWAGGMGHTGDLELVADVVRDLADEVDWVFFGMCPEKLRPFITEVHEGIDINLYPRKLASMNLDLAIAPLEDNLFNRCKSNLRLLEYGACGFPVVCSDVEPYRQHDLPVTRVRNRYKDWVDAIRMHLGDMDETARCGDRLQQVIRNEWMLEGDHLQAWAAAWTKA